MQNRTINTGDDDYDTSLQRLMQQCLPPILVEVVDRRPPDPIQYMAQCLYRYRETVDELSASDSTNQAQSISEHQKLNNMSAYIHGIGANSHITREIREPKSVAQHSGSAGVGLAEGADEFYELTDDFKSVNISNNMVHQSTKHVFQSIGDMFDDDDIS